MIKVGIGYDVHRLKKGEELFIGGIKIPSAFGSEGHSDGDALIHAIVDGLLGAAGLGDIGKYFPSDDDRWEGAESRLFLSDAHGKIKNAGYKINNIDSTVILARPRLAQHTTDIVNNLAEILDIYKSRISVKATTTDGLGFIGDELGWGVLAIVSISDK